MKMKELYVFSFFLKYIMNIINYMFQIIIEDLRFYILINFFDLINVGKYLGQNIFYGNVMGLLLEERDYVKFGQYKLNIFFK